MSSSEGHRISITICGDGGCGKSSITLRLVRSQWTHEYDPTIGVMYILLNRVSRKLIARYLEDSYSVTRTIDGTPHYLSLTDTAGQEEYRGLWAASNLRSDAFLFVYDITQASSLHALEYFLQMVDQECDHRQDTGQVPPVKIMAGNKCDLKDSRVINARQGLEFARARGCGFMETSAREMVNVEETFALLVRRVVAARQAHAERQTHDKLAVRADKTGNFFNRNITHGNRAYSTPLSRGQGQLQSQTASPPMDISRGRDSLPTEKEVDASSEFADRPGTKKTKRTGFRARFRCW